MNKSLERFMKHKYEKEIKQILDEKWKSNKEKTCMLSGAIMIIGWLTD